MLGQYGEGYGTIAHQTYAVVCDFEDFVGCSFERPECVLLCHSQVACLVLVTKPATIFRAGLLSPAPVT